MTVTTLFGSLFIAFAVPFAMYIFVVSKSPKLIVISVSSAFAWLISLLCTAIVWNIVLPLKVAESADWFKCSADDNITEPWWSLFLAVPFQELFRFLFWKLLKFALFMFLILSVQFIQRRAESGMNILGDDNGHVITREKVALVSGVGYGTISVAINFNIVLGAAGGPGSIPAPGCSEISFFAASAMMAMIFGILNIFWSVIANSGFETVRSNGLFTMGGAKIAFVILGHYFAAFLTLNNEKGSCAGTLVPLYILTAVTVFMAYRISGVSFASKS